MRHAPRNAWGGGIPRFFAICAEIFWGSELAPPPTRYVCLVQVCAIFVLKINKRHNQ